MPLPRLNYYKYQATDNLPDLDVYDKAIDSIAKQYDKTMDDRDKMIKSLGSIQSNQHGQKYLQTISSNVNSTLDSLVNSVRETGNFGLAENTIRDLSNTLASDKVLDAIKVSQKNVNDSLPGLQKLSENGEVINLSDDYENYKPVNEDGTVNVYKPIYQNVADYHKTAKEFMKDLPTTVNAIVDSTVNIPGHMAVKQTERLMANKKREMIPRFLSEFQNSEAGKQQALVLSRRYKKEGLNDKQIQEKINQMQEDTVSLAFDDREDEVYKEKLQLVADPIYEETKYQRRRTEAREDRSENVSALEEQKQENRLEVIEARAKAKRLERSGANMSADVLSSEVGLKNTAINSDSKNNVSTFISSKHIQAYADQVGIPNGNDWSGVQYDKSVHKVPENSIITKFRPRGVTTGNEFEPKFDGSWYGELTYTDADGKNPRTMNAYVQNRDNSIVQNYKTINEINRAEIELRRDDIVGGKKYKIIKIEDNSQLFPGYNGPITLEVIRNEKGIRITPTIAYEEGGKIIHKRIADIPSSTKKRMKLDGILSHYTSDQIRNISNSHFSKQMQVPVLPNNDLSTIEQ